MSLLAMKAVILSEQKYGYHAVLLASPFTKGKNDLMHCQNITHAGFYHTSQKLTGSTAEHDHKLTHVI